MGYFALLVTIYTPIDLLSLCLRLVMSLFPGQGVSWPLPLGKLCNPGVSGSKPTSILCALPQMHCGLYLVDQIELDSSSSSQLKHCSSISLCYRRNLAAERNGDAFLGRNVAHSFSYLETFNRSIGKKPCCGAKKSPTKTEMESFFILAFCL